MKDIQPECVEIANAEEASLMLIERIIQFGIDKLFPKRRKVNEVFNSVD